MNKITAQQDFLWGCSSLAARKLIQLLQDREENDNVKKEIIQLGCRYGKQIKQEIYKYHDANESN
jgi:hypothetical protein